MAGEDVLSYLITAHDLATPVFKAFGGQVNLMTRQVQADLAAMNRSFAGQQAEMDRLATSQKSLTVEQGKSAAAMNTAGAAAAGLGGKEKGLAAEVEGGTGALGRHGKALKEVEGAAGTAGTAATGLGGKVRGATTEITKHEQGLKEAGYALSGFSGELGPFGRSLDTASKHAQLFRSQGIDYIAAGLIAAPAAFAVYGVKAAMTFETLGKSVQAQTGATSAATQSLLADIKQVATQSPASYQTIAAAVSAQYKLFGDNNAAIKKNTDLFIAFSDKAGSQVTPTIVGLNAAMKLWHPTGMNIVDMMDQLTKLAQTTQQPLGNYLNIITKYGPSLQAMGLSFQQTVGLFDAFAKAGVSTNMVGRGLTTVMTKAETAIKAANTAVADGPTKLKGYGLAVDSAQISVNRLAGQLDAGKGNQQQLNDQMVVAQGRLSAAKDKYDAYNKALHDNADAHQSVATVVGKELAAIESAKTKNDALNLSIKDFGGRLGPQMADALYKNKTALDGMEASLGSTKDATEKLAEAQRSSLSAQMTILGHDFTNIAGTVGQDLLPALHSVATVLTTIATGIEQFSTGSTKGLAELIAGLGMGAGAVTLLARHTPLGALTSNLPGPLGSVLSRQGGGAATSAVAAVESSTAGLFGMNGTKALVGSRANPMVVFSLGGGVSGIEGKGASVASETNAAATETSVASGVTRAAPVAEGAAVPAVESVAAGGVMAGAKSAAMGIGMGAMVGVGVQQAVGLKGGAVGDLVGGGLGAAAGFALGGPFGAAVGAGIGTTLGPTVGHLLSGIFGGGESYGNHVAGGFSKGFGSNTDLKKTVASLLDQAAALNHPSSTTKVGQFGKATTTQGVETEAQIAKAKADQFQAGQDIAKQLEAGWTQYKFQSEPVMFEQFSAETRKLPPIAQEAALQSTIAFSQSMVANKRLPAGATQQLISDIENQFPGLVNYMGLSAGSSVATFTKALDFSKSQTATKTAMDSIANDFSGVQLAISQTSGTTIQKAGAATKALVGIAANGSGPMRAAATADLKQLEAAVATQFNAMDSVVTSKMSDIKGAVLSGSMSAAKSASTYWGQFVSTVKGAESAGALSVAEGNKIIAAELASALAALGVPAGDAKKLAGQGWSVGAVASGMASISASGLGATTSSGALAVNATGGRVPGAPGPDNWTLVDPSGRPAARVAGAELIANRHTEQRVDRMLAPYGTTLGAQVAGEHVPHYATGGIIGASDFGGPSDPGTGSTGYRGDSLIAHPDSYAELNMGTALGGLPYMAPLDVTFGSRTARLYKRDIGAGGGSVGGHTRGIDLWWQAAQQLGFPYPGLGLVGVSSAGGDNVKISGGGGVAAGGGGSTSVPVLKAPHVSGGGMVGGIAQGALNQTTAAANAQLRAAAARVAAQSASSGGGGGGSFTFQQYSGKLPDPVQRALQVAQYIVGRHVPYGTGEYGAYYGDGGNAPSYDCSGLVSTILNLAGLDPAGHLLTGGLKSWGDPGPGKYITVGVLGADSGPTGHTMMEIANQYFESGGGGGGPHTDSGWSSFFPVKRHPPGLAKGGRVGNPNAYIIGAPGHQPSASEFAADRAVGLAAHGGRIGNAGAFGTGGSFTANSPTVAMFGENGPETVVAIPHASLGTNVSSDFVGAHPYVPPAAKAKHKKATSGTSETWGYNALDGQVEQNTTEEWRKIRAEEAAKHAINAEEKKKATAALKAHAAHMAQDVSDRLVIGPGAPSGGSVEMSRKAALADHLPGGGAFSLMGADLNRLTTRGYSAVSGAFGKTVGADPLTTQMALAGRMAGGGLSFGADRSMVRQDDAMTKQIARLNEKADKAQAQSQQLHDKAMHEHGSQRARTMSRAHADHGEAQKYRQQASVLGPKLDALGAKIAASRPAQLADAAIAAALKSVTTQFTQQQAKNTDVKDTMASIAALGPGTTAKSLGLSATQLKALGMTSGSVASVAAGGTSGVAADRATIAYLRSTEIPGDKSSANQLQKLYADALKTHNIKLQQSLLTQLDAVTKATIAAQGSLKAAMVAEITDTASAFSAKSTSVGAAASISATISGLAPGTSLSGMGLTPAELKTMGVNSGWATALEGTSTSYLQNKIATTGAPLSASDMAGAKAGTLMSNASVTAQMQPIQQEISYYQQQLSSGALSGTDATSAVTAMQGLGSQLLALQGTIVSNNSALEALTQANVTATNTMLSTQASNIGASASLLGTIQNLAPGTDLGALGLSPTVMATLGLNSGSAGALEGSGMTAINADKTAQNGVLTAAQLAAAQAGTNAQNALLTSQEAPIQQQLAYDQAQLPTLDAADQAALITTMQGLAASLVGLQSTVQSNNTAMAALTQATAANTNATGQMTGSVAYTYNSQNYTASMTSDDSTNLGVGV